MNKSKKMEMSTAYLFVVQEETAPAQAPGWSAISRVLTLTLFPVLLTVQANVQDL